MRVSGEGVITRILAFHLHQIEDGHLPSQLQRDISTADGGLQRIEKARLSHKQLVYDAL